MMAVALLMRAWIVEMKFPGVKPRVFANDLQVIAYGNATRRIPIPKKRVPFCRRPHRRRTPQMEWREIGSDCTGGDE